MRLLRILPYKPGSHSAKAIAAGLNGLRVRFQGTFVPKMTHLVLNWGKAERPRWWPRVANIKALNEPFAVARASNKAIAFRLFKEAGVVVPEFTEVQQEAQQWVAEGSVVVGRRVLNGHGGIGCLIFDQDNPQVQSCPLYTKHVRHKREFRIHVFKGKVIDQVEKLRERGVAERDPWIRNHDHGYVFARNIQPIPDNARQEAVKAVAALSLDFGAVDIAYREKEGRAFVLEVNTAPGIEGTTIQRYIEAIREEMVR